MRATKTVAGTADRPGTNTTCDMYCTVLCMRLAARHTSMEAYSNLEHATLRDSGFWGASTVSCCNFFASHAGGITAQAGGRWGMLAGSSDQAGPGQATGKAFGGASQAARRRGKILPEPKFAATMVSPVHIFLHHRYKNESSMGDDDTAARYSDQGNKQKKRCKNSSGWPIGERIDGKKNGLHQKRYLQLQAQRPCLFSSPGGGIHR